MRPYAQLTYLPLAKLVSSRAMLLRLDRYALSQLLAQNAFARCTQTGLKLSMQYGQPVLLLTMRCDMDGGGFEEWKMVCPAVDMRVQRERRLAVCMRVSGAHRGCSSSIRT